MTSPRSIASALEIRVPLNSRLALPETFTWGVATAAYQIEGSARSGGRRPSIWDTFSHTPGATYEGHTGDVAADHYERWQEDLDLLAHLGVGAYRFSISWSRVIDAQGGINPLGLDFYERLIDGLLERGVDPVPTLYHWDLPQDLQDRGGWTNRDTAYHFADYAGQVASRVGDRVSVWGTLNEPWCSAFLGYASGVHAPGIKDDEAALSAAHHLNLAHGLGSRAIRSILGASAKTLIALNLHVVRPADPQNPDDVDAARQIDAIGNRIFLDPIMGEGYPRDLVRDLEPVSDLHFILDGDEELIAAKPDLLGLNYYNTSQVRAPQAATQEGEQHSGGHGDGNPWVGAGHLDFLPAQPPLTEMGWNIDPSGLGEMLRRIAQRYPDLPIAITENGAAFPDRVTDGRIEDTDRIDYVARHIAQIETAVAEGIDVRAYFLWSLLDNFEWAFGYSKRFGIVHVDYETQARTLKASGEWYRDLIRAQRSG